MGVKILIGDVRERLKELASDSVDCVVTSPPYWGLRDYGVDGQLGMETTLGEHVETMASVFADVRRILKPTGTLWLNYGDSYAHGAPGGGSVFDNGRNDGRKSYEGDRARGRTKTTTMSPGLKPKDLCGIPWRVAFALQADGWWLRQDIIWSKPNPMPESVTDRCTKAHEYVFLLAKGQSKRRTVELANLGDKRFHLGGDDSGSDPDTWAVKLSVGIAAAILNSAQIQEHLRCTSFDPQEWKQKPGSLSGHSIVDLPPVHRMAAYASRLLNADATAKQFLTEVHRIGLDLSQGDHFLIRGSDAKVFYTPAVNSYGKTSIAIHDAGKIGQFDLFHGQIIAHTPTTCTYYFDAEAIAEPVVKGFAGSEFNTGKTGEHQLGRSSDKPRRATGAVYTAKAYGSPQSAPRGSKSNFGDFATRNKRSVWEIATQPFSEAHFATFPPALIEPCILAGSPKGGLVLDPFGGAGTTGLVADRLGRDAVLIELNPEYAEIARRRIHGDAPMFAEVSAA